MLPKFEQFIQERRYLHNVSPATVTWHTHNLKWLPSEAPTEDELKQTVLHMREKGLSRVEWVPSWVVKAALLTQKANTNSSGASSKVLLAAANAPSWVSRFTQGKWPVKATYNTGQKTLKKVGSCAAWLGRFPLDSQANFPIVLFFENACITSIRESTERDGANDDKCRTSA